MDARADADGSELLLQPFTIGDPDEEHLQVDKARAVTTRACVEPGAEIGVISVNRVSDSSYARAAVRRWAVQFSKCPKLTHFSPPPPFFYK